MNRSAKTLATAVLLVGVLAMAGCSGTTGEKKEAKGGMGEVKGVWGYVASPDRAAIELNDSQIGAESLSVARVLAPEDGWIVVHVDEGGKPGARVGLAHVSKGENTDIQVPLEGVTSPKVIVAVHADRGTAGEFDFDMMKKATSPDRPFFVAGKELAKVAEVRDFGVKAEEGSATISVSDQPDASGSLTIQRVTAPTGAWVVVHNDADGMPGKRVGLLQIPVGTTQGLTVPLTTADLTPDLLVAVHADQGIIGTFEFDMGNKIGSPDQPFFVGGKEVAAKVRVR